MLADLRQREETLGPNILEVLAVPGFSIWTKAAPSSNLASTADEHVDCYSSNPRQSRRSALKFSSQWQRLRSSLVLMHEKGLKIIRSCLTRNIESRKEITVIFLKPYLPFLLWGGLWWRVTEQYQLVLGDSIWNRLLTFNKPLFNKVVVLFLTKFFSLSHWFSYWWV